MAANRFRSPIHPKQSPVARGGMTDDKTEQYMALRAALRALDLALLGEAVYDVEPPLYIPPARRSKKGLRNLPRKKQAAIRRDLRKKEAEDENSHNV